MESILMHLFFHLPYYCQYFSCILLAAKSNITHAPLHILSASFVFYHLYCSNQLCVDLVPHTFCLPCWDTSWRPHMFILKVQTTPRRAKLCSFPPTKYLTTGSTFSLYPEKVLRHIQMAFGENFNGLEQSVIHLYWVFLLTCFILLFNHSCQGRSSSPIKQQYVRPPSWAPIVRDQVPET